MRNSNLLLTHSWSHNIGDATILYSTIKAIRDVAPMANITVLASDPAFTMEVLPQSDADIKGWIWPIDKPDPGIGGLLRYACIFASNLFTVISYRLMKAELYLLNKQFAPQMKSYFESDVVICVGGDYLGPDYFFLTTLSELLYAKILGKKSILFGQTIGPFRNFLVKSVVSAVLNHTDIIIVREPISAGYLREMGVSRFHVTADLSFACDFKKTKCTTNDVIIVAKKPKKKTVSAKYAQTLGALAKRISEDFGYQVILLSTELGDIPYQRELAGHMPEYVRLNDKLFDPQETARMIGASKFIISSRMHAIILGCLSSTPFYALGNSHKFTGVLESICEDCHTDFSEIGEDTVEKILLRMKDRERLRSAISTSFPSMVDKARNNSLILKNCLQDWGLI